MMKSMLGALAAVALVAATSTAALAECGGQKQSSDTAPTIVGQEGTMDEVAGVRIVPSIIAKQVSLTPSAWILKDAASRLASAEAKIYTNAQNEIIGLTVKSLGLPDAERINPRFSTYVVWLVNSKNAEVMNIGTLESKNGGEAIFGFEPTTPLRGFDRIMVTPEATFATRSPVGWEQLTADIPMSAMVPMPTHEMPQEPMAPIETPQEPTMP